MPSRNAISRHRVKFRSDTGDIKRRYGPSLATSATEDADELFDDLFLL